MMRIGFAILFSVWYLLGSVFLPLGDFSVIPSLHSMFNHCKAHEDKDLNVLEFFGEHLTGLGIVLEGFDHEKEHESRDEEGDQPHAPIQFQFQMQQVVCTASSVGVLVEKPVILASHIMPTNDNLYLEGYTTPFFRPPIL